MKEILGEAMHKKHHEVHLEATGEIKDSVVVIFRTYFSIRHIQSALLFAEEAGKIEVSGEGDTSAIHQANVIASIFATVAFLEANINEIFTDSYDTMRGKSANDGKNIPESLINQLGSMWQLDVPKTAKYSILQKYQIALVTINKPLYDKGTNPYQDVDLLVKLRNALMHPEPESVVSQTSDDDTLTTEQKFFKMLGSKFALNPLTGKGNSFYPDKCLSYGCCKWGIESSFAFTDEFCARTDIKCKYLGLPPS
ncbi:MAG: hypothetical protein WBB67_04260 [bacterium]